MRGTATRFACGIVVAVLAAGPSARVSASEPTAAERAVTLTNESRYAEAAAAFEEAFAATGEAAFLYARAMSLRRAGSCDGAIRAFERFVAQDPPAADVDAAQEQIEECRRVLDDAESTEVPPPVVPVEVEPLPEEPAPQPMTPAPADSVRPDRWYRDPAGGALLGAGVLVGATGGALLGVAFGNSNVPSGETETGFMEREKDVRRLSTAGTVLAAAGGAAVVAAIVRYAIVRRKLQRASEKRGLTWKF